MAIWLVVVQVSISTLSNIYGRSAQNNITFAGSSKLTIIVTGGLTVACGVLTLFYKFFLLRNPQNKHGMDHGEWRAGSRGDGQ